MSAVQPLDALTNLELTPAQRQEIDYWATSEAERPEADFMPCMIAKLAEFGPVFSAALEGHAEHFRGAIDILELGGGQGWASCMLKSRFPAARVVATDISPFALQTLPAWERTFGVKVDEALACTSNRMPFADASFDVVFAFAAAHHFRTHKRTLAEIGRVLRPGGVCIYLYEPSCHSLLYPLALWRVERKRPNPPEDVMRYREITSIAESAGFATRVELNLNLSGRGPVETLYYVLLRRLPEILWFLPCTMDYIFVKRATAT